MLLFFAPISAGGARIVGELRNWRSYAARVSAYLHTPLPMVQTMWWDEVLLWHEEARMIHRESFGLLMPQAANKGAET